MNKIINILPLTLLMLVLTACAKGVSTVEKKQATNEADLNENFSYDTLENIENGFDSSVSAQFENITLASGIKMTFPQKAACMKIHECEADTSLAEKLIQKYSVEDPEISDEDVMLVNSSQNGEYIYLDKSGAFSWEKDNTSLQFGNDGLSGYIYLNCEYDDIELELSDGTLSLSRAVEMSDEYIEEYCELIDTNTYVPVSAKYNEDGFIIYYTDCFDGYTVPECFVSSYDSGNVNSEVFISATKQCFVKVTSSTVVTGIADQTGCAHISEYTREYDEIITLDSALEFLDENMASRMKCRVVGISLVQINNVRETTEIKETDSIDLSLIYGESNYETSPFWQFILKTEGESEEVFYALIDVQTGEFAFGGDATY